MRRPSARLLLMATILHLAGFRLVSALTVSVPLTAPPEAQPLAQTLVSLSIEQDRWPDWTGVHARNEFTYNALTNYAALTGRPPTIRVGANSEDHTVWSPTEPLVHAVFPPPDTIAPYPEATRITVGDEFYRLSRYLPNGTHMVWGVNLGANNATNAANMAAAIARAFRSPTVSAAGVVLDRIEVGNEPDLYTHNGLRPSANWTAADYVREWTASAQDVVRTLGITGRDGPVTLQGAAFANQGFTPRKVYDLGILNGEAGRAVSVISQHHYSAHFCKGGNFSLVSFMNKAAVRANLSIFDGDIAATHARGLDYILGETNSIACHGAPGVSNSAGSALWAIDYTLQAATRGIREVFFHEGIGYKYNLIQPVSLNRSIVDGSPLDRPSPPQILPSYYAGLVVNTFLGNTGSSRIVELAVNDTNVSGYAAFEDGRLVRAVFVNLHGWFRRSKGPRPSIHIAVDLNLTGAARIDPGENDHPVVVRRMVMQHADDTGNLTWAGQSFETETALPKGSITTEGVAPGNDIQVPSSEAVLLDFTGEDPPPIPDPVSPTPETENASGNRDQKNTYIGAGVAIGILAATCCASGVWYGRRRMIRIKMQALAR